MNKTIIFCFVALLLIGVPVVFAATISEIKAELEAEYSLLSAKEQRRIAIAACVDARFMDKTPQECIILADAKLIPIETVMKYILLEELSKRGNTKITETEEEKEEEGNECDGTCPT